MGPGGGDREQELGNDDSGDQGCTNRAGGLGKKKTYFLL